MDPTKAADLSDMISAGTDQKSQGIMGHPQRNYWRTHGICKEPFAEMTSATMVNPESLELIKKHLPRTYDIYREIMEAASNGTL